MHIPTTLSRRLAVGLATIAATSSWPGLLPLPATATSGLSRDALLRKLSRVPVFVVTNQDDAPYLTEVDAQRRRSGFFFLGPQEAVTALNDIRAFDPSASLSVVSLDGIWFDISKSADEAATAPQPKAGTSTDLRLFRLRPLQDAGALADRERATASGVITTKEKKLGAEDIPLYYDPTFSLSVDGQEQRPYFFRLPDLKKSYQQQMGRDLSELPSLRVSTLSALINALQAGDASAVEPPVLLVAASEAGAVVERMSAGSTTATSDADGSAPSSKLPSAAPDASSAPDPFFLSVPFGGGKIKS